MLFFFCGDDWHELKLLGQQQHVKRPGPHLDNHNWGDRRRPHLVNALHDLLVTEPYLPGSGWVESLGNNDGHSSSSDPRHLTHVLIVRSSTVLPVATFAANIRNFT